jgi:hypothetical protein
MPKRSAEYYLKTYHKDHPKMKLARECIKCEKEGRPFDHDRGIRNIKESGRGRPAKVAGRKVVDLAERKANKSRVNVAKRV